MTSMNEQWKMAARSSTVAIEDGPTPTTARPSGGGTKRTAADAGWHVIGGDKELLEFTPLGSGSEVGRSCHIIRFKGKTIMLDCGIHPAYSGISALPFFDAFEQDICAQVDILLISHFHLDHAAALPYLLEKTQFKGRVFMTHPTRSIYKLILQDYVKVSTISIDETLYDEQDLLNSMEKIEVINYRQVVHHKGIKFWCYNAGHVLGAAMFMIEIAGVKILYTGDYSRREDRHLMSAETPEVKPDILIVESTYGVQSLPPVHLREKRFCELVHNTVKRGGRCLIPVFALGRAQELLLILDEYWQANPSLHKVPIYYASALAKKCMAVYQTYTYMMNKKIQAQSEVSNPFDFKFIFPLKGMDQFIDTGPCVIMASPGMLQNGLSRELFELWCSDKKNGVIIPGYCVEGTLARTILSEPSHIKTMSGAKVPLNMSVHYVSFSAHADYAETSEFVDLLRPPHVVLVHGDSNEMGRLQAALKQKYDGTLPSMQILAPKNCQTLEFEFRRQKIAKAVGNAAAKPPVDGVMLRGLLVRKDFNYTIMETEDLSSYTPLSSTTVTQTLKVPFHQTFETLKHFIGQMYDLTIKVDALEHDDDKTTPLLKSEAATDDTKDQKPKEEEKEEKAKPSTTLQDDRTIMVHGAVSITMPPSTGTTSVDHVVLAWKSNPVHDMISDSVISLILSIEANPGSAKFIGVSHGHHHPSPLADELAKEAKYVLGSGGESKIPIDSSSSTSPSAGGDDELSELMSFLQHQYGNVERLEDGKLRLPNQQATLDITNNIVECSDETIRTRIARTLQRTTTALQPIKLRTTAPPPPVLLSSVPAAATSSSSSETLSSSSSSDTAPTPAIMVE